MIRTGGGVSSVLHLLLWAEPFHLQHSRAEPSWRMPHDLFKDRFCQKSKHRHGNIQFRTGAVPQSESHSRYLQHMLLPIPIRCSRSINLPQLTCRMATKFAAHTGSGNRSSNSLSSTMPRMMGPNCSSITSRLYLERCKTDGRHVPRQVSE